MFENLSATFLENLYQIAVAFGIFALSVIANIIVSTYYNTRKLKQSFNAKRLFDGLLKMICIGLGSGLMAIIVMLAGQFLPDTTSEIMTIATLLSTYGVAIIKYFTEAYTTFQDILTNRDIIEDTEEDIQQSITDTESTNKEEAVNE